MTLSCRVCSAALFPEPVLTLPGMPRAAQYYPTASEFSEDKGIVLDVYQCAACGLVQLCREPVPYFKEVITATGFSAATRSVRLQKMATIVERFGLAGKSVLELGSGKGEMLDVLKESALDATGLEASTTSVQIGRQAGRKMIAGYIEELDALPGAPFEAFVSFNYLEHVAHPGNVIRKLHELSTSAAIGYVTVPNLAYLLATKCLYEFVADHLSYFTAATLRFAFERAGFDVLECGLINNDNDVEILVRKRRPLNLADDYGHVERLCGRLQTLVQRYTERGKKVAAWGAGHRALALLALAGCENISYLVDSASFKQGKFTPVLHHKILAPDELKRSPVDLVIIMVPGLYPQEVLKTLKAMDVGADIALLGEDDIKLLE